jgi:hypothetical protein
MLPELGLVLLAYLESIFRGEVELDPQEIQELLEVETLEIMLL